METILEKYNRIRPNITDGCLFLMSKNAFISRVIRNCDDKAEFSHIGLIFSKTFGSDKRLFIIDSNENGVHPELLSARINACNNFAIIKPLCSLSIIEDVLWNSFLQADESIKYDFFGGFKELVNRKFGTTMKITRGANHKICSDWVRDVAIKQDMVNLDFGALSLPFPQDYIRYRNINTTELM